ncbi:PAS domain-containing protein [Pyxidicoccus parkwayensis]|uniref:histidine kinase n=1 Tax=Pyxidicoccus parkwayensis TaxID=2813578 RepID=A0ABX7P2W5_9BACT|nr:PAS domain-containing protein [Pyxidicoccus parkwaysis]QSQ24794.1 PAS domain-containing protein [Pyxidicoccus parkwaysis]
MLGHGAGLTDREPIEGISSEQSRLFLEAMVASAPVGLAFVDLDLRFIHINETLADINGLPRHAHLGRKVRDVVPELWPAIEAHYRQVMETGRPALNLEIHGPTHKDGGATDRHYRVNYYPVRDSNGSLQGIGITVVETTQSELSERALRMSEQRYRSLVESMSQTVWTTNSRGEVVEPAPRWLVFTGQSLGGHLGLGWLAAIHPSDRTRFVAEWSSALEKKQPYRGEARLRRHDGRYRDTIIRSVPVFDDRGFVREWISTAEDITEHKHAEASLRRTTQALRESDERYRTFVGQSTEGIWRLEVQPPIDTRLPEDAQVQALLEQTTVAEANEMMARMTGFASAPEMLGIRLGEMLARLTLDADHVEKAFRPFIRNGYRNENVETRIVDGSGVERVRMANVLGVVERGMLVRIWGTQRDVTEQVRAKEALEQSREIVRMREHQLRAITDALPALVAYIDRDERYVFCNRAFETWFGLEPEGLVGQHVRMVAGELGYAHLKDWMRKALAGETVSYESALTPRDGRLRHVQSTYVPTHTPQGAVKGFVALVNDITDRKRAEAEVEVQRARLHDTLMNVPASIAILNGPDLVFTLVNPIYRAFAQGVDLTGQSLVDMTRRSGTGDDYCRQLKQVYETGRPFFMKETLARVDRGDGVREDRFFHIAYVPLRDADGRVDSVMSYSIEVTDQVRARQKAEELAAHLTNQQQWLESVLDLIPTAFLLIEPDTGRVLFANQAAHRMAGGRFPLGVRTEGYANVYHLTDEQGRPVPPEQSPAGRAARGERLKQAPVVWHTAAGTFSLLTDSELMPAAHGHPATAVLALQDVTQLKRTEAQLQESVRLRDEFLTVASHELKTPLTPLQIKLQGLAREALADVPNERLRERVRTTAESASWQVRKLTALINDLLDVTQLTGETPSLQRDVTDLSAVLREVAEQFRTQSAQAGCDVLVEAPAPVVGWWDRHRLAQVARGLLSNAIKYGPGRPVVLRVERWGDKARFTVRDEGIGIAPENLSRIFEKFGRAVSTRNYGGLGLGLFISRRIVEAHQGTIHAESRQGEGTTFVVELPLNLERRPPGAARH